MIDVDTSWLTPITKTAPMPTPDPKPVAAPKPPPAPTWRRAVRRVERSLRG